jgi:hypothetical protein
MNRLTNFLCLAGGMLIGCLTLVTGGGTTARAQAAGTQKPNILFIMGDDIGWMQPSIYHRGLMVRETPNIESSTLSKITTDESNPNFVSSEDRIATSTRAARRGPRTPYIPKCCLLSTR